LDLNCHLIPVVVISLKNLTVGVYQHTNQLVHVCGKVWSHGILQSNEREKIARIAVQAVRATQEHENSRIVVAYDLRVYGFERGFER